MTNTELKREQNPLLIPSSLPFGALNFSEIKSEHFEPAIDAAISKAKDRLAQYKTLLGKTLTFENAILGLEAISEDSQEVFNIFSNMTHAHTNETLQKLEQLLSPRLASLHNEILLDDTVFQILKEAQEMKSSWNLDSDQTRLMDIQYDEFIRNGANLEISEKEKLKKLDEELSVLSPRFAENSLKSTNAFAMHLLAEADLDGLPNMVREDAAHAAKEKGLSGWLFTLQGPSWVSFLTYSARRDLREKLWRAVGSRAYKGEFDNSEVVLKLVNLRHQRAQLLGFESHADFILKKRMAETPQRVHQFIDQLIEKMRPAAIRDLKAVTDFALKLNFEQKYGTRELKPWDIAFYSEKLKEHEFQFSEEELRPYFKLENAVNGVFEIVKRLYGLSFKKNKEISVYHEDVEVFEVYGRDSRFIGLFYMDFFPRESKRSGAWMSNHREPGLRNDGTVQRPHVVIVCNFPKPTEKSPSLLAFDDVHTLFHEFGHALHSLLTEVKYRPLAGTNVYWDFVELPSQIMENWLGEREALQLFAKHYETGLPLPEDLLQKVIRSKKFLAGWYGLRQLNLASLDMAWHDRDPAQIKDVAKFEDMATDRTRLLPSEEGVNTSCAFGHLFAGGYSAGYYSYKWAEVLDADAFEMFKSNGIFDANTAQKFRENILAKGGSKPPLELYKAFRGREPDPDALLRRDGLI